MNDLDDDTPTPTQILLAHLRRGYFGPLGTRIIWDAIIHIAQEQRGRCAFTACMATQEFLDNETARRVRDIILKETGLVVPNNGARVPPRVTDKDFKTLKKVQKKIAASSKQTKKLRKKLGL